MKVIIQRTRRKKTEHGFVFNEQPQVICLDETFPDQKKESVSCGSQRRSCRFYKKHIATVPFGKHYSPCEKKLNPCVPDNALVYKEGKFSEIPQCEPCKKRSKVRFCH